MLGGWGLPIRISAINPVTVDTERGVERKIGQTSIRLCPLGATGFDGDQEVQGRVPRSRTLAKHLGKTQLPTTSWHLRLN